MQETTDEYLLSAFPLEGGEMVRLTCVALADDCSSMFPLSLVKAEALREAFELYGLQNEASGLRLSLAHKLPYQVPLHGTAVIALAQILSAPKDIN